MRWVSDGDEEKIIERLRRDGMLVVKRKHEDGRGNCVGEGRRW